MSTLPDVVLAVPTSHFEEYGLVCRRNDVSSGSFIICLIFTVDQIEKRRRRLPAFEPNRSLEVLNEKSICAAFHGKDGRLSREREDESPLDRILAQEVQIEPQPVVY